ncbi:MAG TPA: DUF3300 domain-containing protein, partial [Syntrophobacteraceae bacterium]|nr:DUF3300 domain-containing protein [Syntrophobacteraceae bacterium]
MKRNSFPIRVLIGVLVVIMVPFGAFAQQDPEGAGTFSQQELDQMVAPIALYPDSLLAQVLIAATYPDQVMEADQWLKAHPNLKGGALNNALDKMNWDLSVKALAPFPQVVAMMAQEPDWTQKLGEAFLAQQADVMDTVQKLRAKARAAGNLKTGAEQKVVVKSATEAVGGITTDYIEIEPANPEVVYVPSYSPAVVYGSWWWPEPPLVVAPVWPGVALGVGLGVGFGFFGAVAVGPCWGWGWGSWGWGSGSMNVNVNRNTNINSNVNRNTMQTSSLSKQAAAGKVGSQKTRAAANARAKQGPSG